MSGTIRTKELLDCYHCGADGHDIHDGLRDLMFDVPGQWAMRRCPDCGLTWLKNQPLVEDIPRLYESYHTHERVQASGYEFSRVVRLGIPARDFGYKPKQSYSYFGALIASWIGPVRERAAQTVMWLKAIDDGKLLDVGCGAGGQLYHLQEMGWRVSGTEPDPKAVTVARELLGTDYVYEGSLEDAGFNENTFDAVISNHVLEHLSDPLETLKECHRVMKPGAQITFATPHIESLGSHYFKEYWRGLEIPRHLFLFTTKSLEEMAQRAGFKNIRVLTPTWLAPFIWQASYILKTQNSLPGGVPSSSNSSKLISLQGLLFWAWEYLLNSMGQKCGEDLVLIAEKQSS